MRELVSVASVFLFASLALAGNCRYATPGLATACDYAPVAAPVYEAPVVVQAAPVYAQPQVYAPVRQVYAAPVVKQVYAQQVQVVRQVRAVKQVQVVQQQVYAQPVQVVRQKSFYGGASFAPRQRFVGGGLFAPPARGIVSAPGAANGGLLGAAERITGIGDGTGQTAFGFLLGRFLPGGGGFNFRR
jgi:hypothetical protein